MVRRIPLRKVSYFGPVAPRLARNTIIESAFEVGSLSLHDADLLRPAHRPVHADAARSGREFICRSVGFRRPRLKSESGLPMSPTSRRKFRARPCPWRNRVGGLDICYRVILSSLPSTTRVSFGVDLSHLESRHIGLLRRLKTPALGRTDERRPLHRLYQRKAPQQFFDEVMKICPDGVIGVLKDRSNCSRKTSSSSSLLRILSTISWDSRRNSSRLSSCSHLLTRTKTVTNRAKNKSIGSATGSARLRHRSRGSPAITSTRGSTTRMPRVSPIHHDTQFVTRSARGSTPRAKRPLNDKLELVTQSSGARRKKRQMSRRLSRGAG